MSNNERETGHDDVTITKIEVGKETQALMLAARFSGQLGKTGYNRILDMSIQDIKLLKMFLDGVIYLKEQEGET
jgi:hypothetical protein|tara:strand:- start:8913 stop:9134 length:222 start_codon:yes stop_codon:yes gene_type:complete